MLFTSESGGAWEEEGDGGGVMTLRARAGAGKRGGGGRPARGRTLLQPVLAELAPLLGVGVVFDVGIVVRVCVRWM